MAEQPDALVVDTLSAAPGEKVRGYLAVDHSATGTIVRLPVILINGERPGKTLVLISGVHGDDLNTIPMVWRITESVTPTGLRGKIIALPVVNPSAFEAGTHLSPIDNSCPGVPGDPAGTLSDRIGAFLYRHVVLQADHLLDLHGGSKSATLARLVSLDGEARPEVVAASKEMAAYFDPELIVVMESKGGKPSRGFAQGASRNGAPSLYIGMGRMGFNEDDTARGAAGVLNIMKHLGMVEGAPQPPASPPPLTRTELYQYTPTGGAFIPAVRAGQAVEEGQLLGEVLDIFGRPTRRITAGVAGIVDAIRFYPVVNAGDWVASVARW